MLETLKGQRVQRLEKVQDYLQIVFQSNDVLNIYNPYSVLGIREIAGGTGSEVKEVSFDAAKLKIEFNTFILEVSIADGDFNGPEALELVAASGLRFVWN